MKMSIADCKHSRRALLSRFIYESLSEIRDKQHLVNLLALGRLYVAEREVQEALSPLPDRPRAILDLGSFFCGHVLLPFAHKLTVRETLQDAAEAIGRSSLSAPPSDPY